MQACWRALGLDVKGLESKRMLNFNDSMGGGRPTGITKRKRIASVKFGLDHSKSSLRAALLPMRGAWPHDAGQLPWKYTRNFMQKCDYIREITK